MPGDDGGLSWTAEGAPRSNRFDDIFFSAADGLAESRAVFLHGCDMPQAWRGRRRFTVAELGFGTGLNILALLHAWRQTRSADQRLSIFSVEAYPLSAAAAGRALAAWPELSDLAERLIGQWPRQAQGFHRLDFPELGAVLDLAVGEAAWALERWTGAADAWFLDGFSPAKNPQMWRQDVLDAVARRSAPGARLATFTVAGAVRRGLAQAGFQVAKAAGHGKKRERLEARLPGEPDDAKRPDRVAVIGAGVAGASLARALHALGLDVAVVETNRPGAGASGNPAALVTAALDAGGGPRAALYAQCLARAADLYGQVGPFHRGVMQMERIERDAARFEAVLASGLFDPARLRRLSAAEAAARSSQPLVSGALLFGDGMVVSPAQVIHAWLGPHALIAGRAATIERDANGWRVLDIDGQALLRADVVCIAAGVQSADLLPSLPLQPVRGQASWAAGEGLTAPLAWGGYATPFDGGLLFGATHDRGDSDTQTTAADHQRNLATLAVAMPKLAATLDAESLGGRASIRAATPDRLPLAGAIGADGLFVLCGLGSRGFATAPLLGEHVAALVAGAPSPLPADVQRIVDPARFGVSAPPQADRKATA
jgi:tRNA 5-methylaminomethyl-2-thiouridine biosynthesis bifunctional protein